MKTHCFNADPEIRSQVQRSSLGRLCVVRNRGRLLAQRDITKVSFYSLDLTSALSREFSSIKACLD